MSFVRVSKSNCLHRANSSATKSNSGSWRELKRVYLQWRFGDHHQVSTTSNRHWLSNQLSRRIGWGEFILSESLSQPLQPDVVLVQKGELVYQTPCRHRAPLVISILLHFLSVVYFWCSLLSIDIHLCTVILYLPSIPFSTVTMLCFIFAFAVLKVVCLYVHLLFIWCHLVILLSPALMNISQ